MVEGNGVHGLGVAPQRVDLRLSLDVPQLDRRVEGRRRQHRRLRRLALQAAAPLAGVYLLVVRQSAHRLLGVHRPDLCRTVIAAGCEHPSRRVPLDRVHLIVVAVESPQWRRAVNLAHADNPICAAGRKLTVVPPIDIEHRRIVEPKLLHELSRPGVPHNRRLIEAAAQNERPSVVPARASTRWNAEAREIHSDIENHECRQRADRHNGF